ncbi:MAG: hypothetical protein JWN98_482 [Abditibacteriota bacterium]|nr:hypothetical protein [Abditibacteriota bacterium]
MQTIIRDNQAAMLRTPMGTMCCGICCISPVVCPGDGIRRDKRLSAL